MGDSQDQFQELLSQLIVRTDRMLAEQNEMFPLALLLLPDGGTNVSMAAYDNVEQIPSLLNAMQTSLSAKAREIGAVASCIAYPDYSSDKVVAFLENSDNYCTRAELSVITEPRLHVDPSAISFSDGDIYVFPVAAS
jgi:hypothetical protein